MNTPSAAVLVLLLTVAAPSSWANDSGVFSRSAIPIWPHVAGSKTPFTAIAADGRSWARLSQTSDEASLRLGVGGAVGALTADLGPGVNAELAWAPDSHALFVTSSDGGNVGTYRLTVIDREGGRTRRHDLSPLVRRAFGRASGCDADDAANVVGVAWLGGSNRLLAVAQAPPHSACKHMGLFQAYEIDVRKMRIMHSYGQAEARARFGPLLGRNL